MNDFTTSRHGSPDAQPGTQLAAQLANAWRDHTQLDTPPAALIPVDAAAAYAIQHDVIAQLGGGVAGWKIGAKSADGPIQGAPLPAHACHASGARFERRQFAPPGLELEIAFRFGRTFEPRDETYKDDEVLASIDTMMATIEIVASRYREWPKIDKLAQLADLQNHGALVVGEAVPYRDDFAYDAPSLRFGFDTRDIVAQTRPANPAGDPRRLLPWLVNHCTQQRRIAVTPDLILTTGSYTGMFFPDRAGVARGEIDGLPAVQLELL